MEEWTRLGIQLLLFLSVTRCWSSAGSSMMIKVSSPESELYSGTASAPPPPPPPPPPVFPPNSTLVNITFLHNAAAKGAVCLDGTLPAYHLHSGSGEGANSWLIQLQGGGWCNNISSCVLRKSMSTGSSAYFFPQIPFAGILSNKSEQNPDFFNWNRAKILYCDGASFAGEGENKTAGLQFRGQRIWEAAMEELMSKGMRNATQVLLSGCSAGGLASIIHCDEFRHLFPTTTKVKCLSDAGLFMDAIDISGRRTLRNFFREVVNLQGVEANLPRTCTDRLDPVSCFFPQNLIDNLKTPLFLLNPAYDFWQIQQSLTSPASDPHGMWGECRRDIAKCSKPQIKFLQGFRKSMLKAVKRFKASPQNGMFINSCFTHCQTEGQDSWLSENSPMIGNKPIATVVGDWYFDRASSKAIDCPYPCDKTCHNVVLNATGSHYGQYY